MSTPFTGMHLIAQFAREASNNVSTAASGVSAAAATASETDKAGKWGIDGWIRVFHDLIDLQIRVFANVLQTGISGPWWLSTTDELAAPEPVEVPNPQPYPRAVTLSEFTRLGYPNVKIQPAGLSVEPLLPANAKQLVITLRDERFIGSNYKGTITLTNPATGAPEVPFEVTVGL